MGVDLLVKDVRLPHEGELVEGNLLVDDGKIVGISKSEPESDFTYEGENNILLPGGVDIHVHFRDPDENPAEDFESGSRAAAHGGITTIADMPNTHPPVTDAGRLREKRKIALKKSLIDFSLYGGLGEKTIGNAAELEKEGVVAIKTFMTSRFPDVAAPNTETIRKIMTDVSKTRLPLMIHAEDVGLIEKRETTKPIDFCLNRPSRVESGAAARICELARQLGARVHLVHLSSKATMDILRKYKAIGAKVSGETAAKYLTLTMDEMKRRGPYAKVDPPLRTKEDIQGLKAAIEDDIVEIIASDHAPYPREEKEKGHEKIDLAPSGVPGVETTIPCMFDLFLKGEFTLSKLLEVLCVKPAKLVGLYPKKGALRIGSDADFVILNPREEFEVKRESLLTETHESPFIGKSFSASPVATFSRGELIIEDHELVGHPGRGEFLSRLDKK